MAAESFVRFLEFWTIICTLSLTPEIQAQTTTVLFSPSSSLLISNSSPTSSASQSAVPSTSTSSASQSAVPSTSTSSASQSAAPSTSAFKPSSSIPASQSTMLIGHSTVALAPTPGEGVAPVSSAQLSSSVKQSTPVATQPTTTTGSERDKLTITEYILIACLGVFGLVLITLVILAFQIARLNKTVSNLKAASRR